MEMIPITNSSQIAAIGWQDETLHIRFIRGETYSYANVRNSLFQELLNAPSIGKVFQARIKNHPELYPHTKQP